MTTASEQKLTPQLNLVKFPLNTSIDYELDDDTEWVQKLLVEMNENATDKSAIEWLADTYLTLDLTLTKKFKNEYGEYLLVKGSFAVKFVTESVRTLKTVFEEHESEFNAVFLDEAVLKTEDFKELDEIWLDNDNYEIYPLQKSTADIAEMLHERLFLSRDLYPLAPGEEDLDASVESDKPRQ